MLEVALTTFADEESAVGCVRRIVGDGLAVCATLLPHARSIYRWKGVLEDSTETVVIFKVVSERMEAFREALLAAHPYETPELIVGVPSWVAPDYMAWARGEH
jgi:periplasmic divalent cation tolerance protein